METVDVSGWPKIESRVCLCKPECSVQETPYEGADKQPMRVAVLLAAYNGASYLRSQVASILEQQDVEVTVFIRDDGSTDGTADLALALSALDSRVICLIPNAGTRLFGSNFLNLIFQVPAHFDAYAFADQDDIWFPQKLADACQKLNAGFDFYSSGSVAFWGSGKASIINPQPSMRSKDYLFQAGGAGCTIVFSGTAFSNMSADLKSKADIASQTFVHDWYVYAFARLNGYRWFMSAEPSMLYRQHDDNYSGANSGKRAIFSRLDRLRNGWYRGMILSVMELTDYAVKGDRRIYDAVKRLSIGDRLWLASRCLSYRRTVSGSLLLALFLLFVIR